MSAVEQVAESLVRGWRDGRQQPVEGLSLESQAQAYEVQQRVAESMGWFTQAPARAWKLGGSVGGFISAAGVPATAVHESGWQVPPGTCYGFGIEAELIVRLGRDLDEHTDLDNARNSIESWMPGIELCDTRWIQGDQAEPLLRLADQQLNRALIVGSAHRLPDLPDWSDQMLQVTIDGQSSFVGKACHPFSDPLHSLPWLARHASSQGNPLCAGDLIATGSWSGICWVPEDVLIEVVFADVGRVKLRTSKFLKSR